MRKELSAYDLKPVKIKVFAQLKYFIFLGSRRSRLCRFLRMQKIGLGKHLINKLKMFVRIIHVAPPYRLFR